MNHSSAIRYQKVQAEIKDAMVILATGGDVMQIYRLDDTLTFDPTVPMRFAYQRPVLAAMTRQTAYDPTEFNLKDIAANAPYCWQVQAFGADKMVAASMYRLVFFTGSAARSD